MRAGINCALANRQIITHLTRKAFAKVLPDADLVLLYDVSHNTCKVEAHKADGASKPLFVHRKGATRALGPNHPDLPEALRKVVRRDTGFDANFVGMTEIGAQRACERLNARGESCSVIAP